ncbi:hypothetical protein TNCV_4524451 [Trichonephila clavipes]|nr:hypothetical protein TNCV_4524451 [Trichonephila clavipes]
MSTSGVVPETPPAIESALRTLLLTRSISKGLSSEHTRLQNDVFNSPTGQHGFFRPTREASKTDHTEFFVRTGTHQK